MNMFNMLLLLMLLANCGNKDESASSDGEGGIPEAKEAIANFENLVNQSEWQRISDGELDEVRKLINDSKSRYLHPEAEFELPEVDEEEEEETVSSEGIEEQSVFGLAGIKPFDPILISVTGTSVTPSDLKTALAQMEAEENENAICQAYSFIPVKIMTSAQRQMNTALSYAAFPNVSASGDTILGEDGHKVTDYEGDENSAFGIDIASLSATKKQGTVTKGSFRAGANDTAVYAQASILTSYDHLKMFSHFYADPAIEIEEAENKSNVETEIATFIKRETMEVLSSYTVKFETSRVDESSGLLPFHLTGKSSLAHSESTLNTAFMDSYVLQVSPDEKDAFTLTYDASIQFKKNRTYIAVKYVLRQGDDEKTYTIDISNDVDDEDNCILDIQEGDEKSVDAIAKKTTYEVGESEKQRFPIGSFPNFRPSGPYVPLDDTVKIYWLGAYEADEQPARGFQQEPTSAGKITVNVKAGKNDKIALVMTNYESVEWILAGDTEAVSLIILSGYYQPFVSGQNKDTPVVTLWLDREAERPPFDLQGSFYAYQDDTGPYYKREFDDTLQQWVCTDELDTYQNENTSFGRSVEAIVNLLGRKPNSSQGAYAPAIFNLETDVANAMQKSTSSGYCTQPD